MKSDGAFDDSSKTKSFHFGKNPQLGSIIINHQEKVWVLELISDPTEFVN